MTSADALLSTASPVFEAAPDAPLGVAVSGGSDSLGLLLLAHKWGQRPLVAFTVNHGLRDESAQEAADVAAQCARLGVPHETLVWTGWNGRGNLQDAARTARRSLLLTAARARGLGAIAVGHTLDDQAETFLLNLIRGSGVDGLSGILPVTGARGDGPLWLRPMLNIRRTDLQQMLRVDGIVWADDPSNDDPSFDRVKIRQAMPDLDALGLCAERLAATADRMAMAREALEIAAQDCARASVTLHALNYATVDPAPLSAAPQDIRLRVIAALLNHVSGAIYRPRLSALKPLVAAICDGGLGGGQTLHGCVLRTGKGGVTVCRELSRTGPAVAPGTPWDGRWTTGASAPGLLVTATGEAGLAALPDWREAGHPRDALLASPAFWRGEKLYAHPVLRPQDGCDARPMGDPAQFLAAFISR